MRCLVLLAAAALCLDARAQPLRSVETTAGEGLMWRGDCVRNKNEHGKPGDPCPAIDDYSGSARADLQREIDERKAHPEKFRDRRPMILLPPDAKNDRFAGQWPLPTDFLSGWPIRYPVVIVYDAKPPEGAPPLENRTLDEVLKILEGTVWRPVARRMDGTLIDLKTRVPRDFEGVVRIQRPRNGELGKDNSLDLYVLVTDPRHDSRPVTPLVGLPARSADARATVDQFVARRSSASETDEIIVSQSPGVGSSAPAGTVIDFQVKKKECNEASVCAAGEICRRPGPNPPCVPEKLPGETIVIREPYPVLKHTREIISVTLGAGGAGAVGGYMFMRVMRRRSDDEDTGDGAPVRSAEHSLNVRVHPDRIGEQEVHEFEAREARFNEHAGRGDLSVAQLLHIDRLGAGLFRETTESALKRSYEEALALKPGLGRAEFLDCIRRALSAALDVSLAEVIAGGWRRHGHEPKGMLIYSTHRSIVDVRAGARLLACIEVRAEVTLALAPLMFEPTFNAIKTDGEAYAGARLYCAGAQVLEEGMRPVAVPLRIALAPA